MTPRRPARWLALLVVLAGSLVVQSADVAWAVGDDVDGPGTLEQQITGVAKAYADARSQLATAQAEQKRLTTELATTNQDLIQQTAQAQVFADAAYRQGVDSGLLATLSASGPDDLLERLTAVQTMAKERDSALANLKAARTRAAQAQAAMARQAEIASARAAELEQQQNKLRAILANASGGPSGVVVAAATADPAPRNSDGTFPAQSCKQDDPTSGGCLTARTLHMYQQVRAAGYTRYVHCWREQSWGEHPKGRACDFAAAVSGFGGKATGADRTYGNRLAGWLIGNADRLGVLYVIWYKQIWLPGQGWHAYTTEGGDPSGDHTNHVHVSMR